MRIVAGVATDIGKVREGNEDSYLVEPPLYAVADGMGGHRGGEVASHLALETVEALFKEGRGDLVEQVKEANRAVFDRGTSDRSVSGMGTTLTAALVDGDGVRLAHVGDSRAYLLRAGSMRMLTEDHTLVNRMVASGEISRSEAEVHPHRSVLTRSIGTERDVDVDESSLALIDGDRLLLCSDGLTAMVTEDQIKAILENVDDPQQAAERLVRAANRAGGVDNITVVVLDAREGEGLAVPGGGAARPRSRGSGLARTIFLRFVIVAVVAGAIVAGFRFYADRQWYVGVANGHVAVYQGLPASFAGLGFSHVVEETTIPASDAESLTLYADLADGITAGSEQAALSIIDQIRSDIAAHSRSTTGPKPSPTPKSSSSR
jgi:PPM family protein phosphatase